MAKSSTPMILILNVSLLFIARLFSGQSYSLYRKIVMSRNPYLEKHFRMLEMYVFDGVECREQTIRKKMSKYVRINFIVRFWLPKFFIKLSVKIFNKGDYDKWAERKAERLVILSIRKLEDLVGDQILKYGPNVSLIHLLRPTEEMVA